MNIRFAKESDKNNIKEDNSDRKDPPKKLFKRKK